MDVNKNSYTFIFAFVLVVVVAALLSFTATSLKPMQDKNVALEKKQNILSSIGVEVSRDESDAEYSKYIKEELVIQNGEELNGVEAFDVDMAKQVILDPSERQAPLYVAEKDGETFYILPLRGKGLWGPIWGYIALENDANTVFGAVFDHKTETPGLGAEISTGDFSDPFKGKKVMALSGEFNGIKVTKKAAQGDYEVDGISGGTITSVGVEKMIDDCLRSYMDYLKGKSGKVAVNITADNNLASIE